MAGRFAASKSVNMDEFNEGMKLLTAIFSPFVALFVFCYVFGTIGIPLTAIFTVVILHKLGVF